MASIKRSYSPDKYDSFWRDDKVLPITINGVLLTPVNRLDFILTLESILDVILLPK